MKYPYIGQRYNAIVLFYAAGKGLLIDNALGFDGDSKAGDEVRLYDGTNITREYLQNTWGVVESKEHAEFIVDLCKANNLSVYKGSYPIKKDIFSVNKHGTLFFHEDNGLSLSKELKQITIPLPPKESYNIEVKNNTELNVDITRNKDTVNIMIDKETPKVEPPEAGHNLVFASSECKEWPCVGDEVIAYDIGFEREMTMIYRGKNKNNASIVEFENGNVILLGFEGKIKKPKTPREALWDELVDELFKIACHVDFRTERQVGKVAFKDLLIKYNIAPKEV